MVIILKNMKTSAILLVILIMFMLITEEIYTQIISGNHFSLYAYSYKSSSDDQHIYPGSRNVELSIYVALNSSSRVRIYGACIILPQGFVISRGFSLCSDANQLNGSTTYLVEPGAIVFFRYHVDVDRSVQPGNYELILVVRYSDGEYLYEQKIEKIIVTVSNYPQPSIEIVNWYWNPEAYPGSENVYLYLILKNSGNSDILQGYGAIELPSHVFTPSKFIININNLYRNMSTSIAIGPLSIYAHANQKPYEVRLILNLTLRTSDGATYSGTQTLVFQVTPSTSPRIHIKIIDYGFVDIKVFQESIRTRFYVTILNQDFAVIRTAIAYFNILSCGFFANNSNQSIYIFQSPINYGSTATLYSDYIITSNTCSVVSINLDLLIFGEIDGAEFWTSQKYSFSLPISLPSLNIRVADVFWEEGYVYPGTKNNNLVIVLENLDVVDVRNIVAKLKLNSMVFYPAEISLSNIAIASGSRSVLVYRSISISKQTSPGFYVAKLELAGIAVTPSGSFFRFNSSYSTLIEVSKYRFESVIEVLDYEWSTGKAYISMINTGLRVNVRISTPFYSIENPVGELHLPPGFVSRNGSNTIISILSGAYSYGQILTFSFQGIDVSVSSPGFYPMIFKINALAVDNSGSEFWIDYETVLKLYVYEPSVNVVLIDSLWINKITTYTTYGASLYISLQSYSLDTITNIVAFLNICNTEVTTISRNCAIISTVSRIINYGDIITLAFEEIDIECENCSYLNLFLTLSVVKSIGSSYYTAKTSYTIRLNLTSTLNQFKVIALNTYYNNNPAPLLPSARNMYININIANIRPYDVTWIKPEILLYPSSLFKINNIDGSCLNGVTRGSVCDLIVNLDVDRNVKPGEYKMILNLTYALYVSNTMILSNEIIETTIVVADYDYYKPHIELSHWYWGIQTPVRVLPGQHNAPLTLVIVNNGRYRVDNVEVKITPLTKNIRTIANKTLCSSTLLPTAYCLATFYIDIDESIEKSTTFNVIIKYVFNEYGAHIVEEIIYTITIDVDMFAGGKGLRLVDSGWINNWPVYPGTENATYVVKLYNSWAYRISSISAMLLLPSGFKSRGNDYVYNYVSGPIQSFQQLELTFTLSISNNLAPGRYWAKLVVEYVVESGLPYMRIKDEFDVYLQVYDEKNTLTLVSVSWLGSVPEPKTYGAILVISIRNNYVPIIKGPVLEIYTPSNILHSDTNTTYAIISATSVSPETIQLFLAAMPRYSFSLNEFLNQFARSYRSIDEYSYGDIFYFYLKLNLLIDTPGNYSAKAYLNFIDHWNNVKKIPVEIPIHILGTARTLEIMALQPLKIENGIANLTIKLVNLGSAPIYNVYIYIVPQTPLLIPSDGVKYIDLLKPDSSTYTSFRLIYNPVALFTGTGVQTIRYSTAVFMITILYRDVSGHSRYFNLSIASVVEPFIEMKIVNARAVAVDRTLTVSGTVINYGLTVARNVEVVVLGGDKVLGTTFLGDIDPATQYAFRIESSVDKQLTSLIIKVSYRDEYNIKHHTNISIPLIYEQKTTTPVALTNRGNEINLQYFVVAIAVALFLILMGILFYKYVKKYVRKLEEKIEV